MEISELLTGFSANGREEKMIILNDRTKHQGLLEAIRHIVKVEVEKQLAGKEDK